MPCPPPQPPMAFHGPSLGKQRPGALGCSSQVHQGQGDGLQGPRREWPQSAPSPCCACPPHLPQTCTVCCLVYCHNFRPGCFVPCQSPPRGQETHISDTHLVMPATGLLQHCQGPTACRMESHPQAWPQLFLQLPILTSSASLPACVDTTPGDLGIPRRLPPLCLCTPASCGWNSPCWSGRVPTPLKILQLCHLLQEASPDPKG